MAYFDEALETAGGRQEIIPVRRRREWLQSWRHVYAARLHAATGQWTWLGYDWHVFSYRHARALAGDRALHTYVAIAPPTRCIVCPHDDRLPAVEITGGAPPDFRNSCLDVSIWPDDLDWTMAFTHEDSWFGPYFSRREWVDATHENIVIPT